ncbi:class E sortase [Streptacidiphilus sp. EB129]|uniref:class E sortase n=1 Tax=Streptacidiphilus sp. EB129 TaxID=3156262 RepID=UPI0035119C2C
MGRAIARTLVELCITAGGLIVLFTVYVLFWTSVTADSAMGGEISRLQAQWQQSAAAPAGSPSDSPTVAAPGGPATASPSAGPAAAAYPPGQAFAVLYIPRFGRDWKKPVVEGTGVTDLQHGIGHYTGTAALGGAGNFALAGHRRTYGNPFNDFPELRPGDAVVLDDGTDWYVYVITRTPFLTLPTDVQVLDPVPAESGFTVPGHYLTLTTCDPPWGHSHRLIEWGRLQSVTPVTQGTPAALRG